MVDYGRVTTPGRTSRRSLLKGAAWSLPTIVVGGAVAPSAAASGTPVTPTCENNTCFTGTAWKLPGTDGTCNTFQAYVFEMTTTNPYPAADSSSPCIYVVVDSMSVPGKTYDATHDYSDLTAHGSTSTCPTGTCSPPAGHYVTIPPGQTVTWDIQCNNAGNSANGQATVGFTAYDSGTCTQINELSGSLQTDVNSLPPESGHCA